MKTKIEGVYDNFISVSTWTPGDCRGLITSYSVCGVGRDVNGREIKVGDKVKVLFGGRELSNKFGWGTVWTPGMDCSINHVFEVLNRYEKNGVKLKDGTMQYCYPWFCLEVVEASKSTQVESNEVDQGVGTTNENKASEGLKTPTARWHSEIAKLYYDDSSLVCQYNMPNGAWVTTNRPYFDDGFMYRLIREAESCKYVMYKPTEKGLTKIVYNKENVKASEDNGWILIHTDFQHKTEVVYVSEAKE